MIAPLASWLANDHRALPRHTRGFRAQVTLLEPRALLAVSGLSVEASLTFLRHLSSVNQPKFYRQLTIDPVTVAGAVNESGPAPPVIHFQVIDEYGTDQPSGTIVPQPVSPKAPNSLLFSTRLGLSLKLRPGDLDGRQYRIIVTAQDAENSQTATVEVTVPRVAFHHGPSRR